MNHATSVLTLLSAVTSLVLGASAVQAAAINLIGDNTGGFGGESWLTAGDWSNGLQPASGNDYHVGNSTGKVLQSPSGGLGNVFGGDSLTIHSTGSLVFRTTSATIGTLIFDGGTLGHSVSGTINLGGSALNITANSVFNATNTDGRDLTLNGVLGGSGGLTLNGGNTGNVFRFNGINSTYSGTITVNTGSLLASGSNSLGNANLIIGTGSQFTANYDILNLSSGLTLNGTMVLNNTHVFSAVTIGGNALADGFYDFNTLNTLYDDYFVDGGIGSITVFSVPEPTAPALGLAGLPLLLMGLRRRRLA